jgi:hypothetical protein
VIARGGNRVCGTLLAAKVTLIVKQSYFFELSIARKIEFLFGNAVFSNRVVNGCVDEE